MQRFVIAKNPGIQIPEGVTTREITRKDLVLLAIGYGLETVQVEGDQKAVWIHFLPESFDLFEGDYMGERQLLLSSRMLSHSNDWWRNLMVSWKSWQRMLDNKPDNNHFVIWKNTSKTILPDTKIRSIDREDYANLVYCYGIEPISCDGDGRTIWVNYIHEELVEFENHYFSNLEITFPLDRRVRATEKWGDYMNMHNARRPNHTVFE